jgi:hypothetical protein
MNTFSLRCLFGHTWRPYPYALQFEFCSRCYKNRRRVHFSAVLNSAVPSLKHGGTHSGGGR